MMHVPELDRALARLEPLASASATSRVALDPFAPLSRSAQRELQEEAERLEAFLAE